MPIIKAAKKALRSSARKRVVNLRRTRAMKAIVKDIRELVAKGEAKKALGKLAEAYKAIDKAAKQGVTKKNAASRMKSRLSAAIKKASKK